MSNRVHTFAVTLGNCLNPRPTAGVQTVPSSHSKRRATANVCTRQGMIKPYICDHQMTNWKFSNPVRNRLPGHYLVSENYSRVIIWCWGNDPRSLFDVGKWPPHKTLTPRYLLENQSHNQSPTGHSHYLDERYNRSSARPSVHLSIWSPSSWCLSVSCVWQTVLNTSY